jgi:DNA polymerase (family X)
MNNSEIVKILEDIAALLDLKGEGVFKSRAYQKAARSIELLPEEVAKLVAENRLTEIPGVGDAIAKKLCELVRTGRLEYYEKLKAQFPSGLDTLLEVPGIGPRTALLLARELNITSLDELEKAIEEGKVAELPRLGEKTARNILRQVQVFRKKKNEQRTPLGEVLPVVDSLMSSLQKVPGLTNLTAAGSLRRFRDTIGDIDLVATSTDPESVIPAFLSLPQVREIIEKGPNKASVIVSEGLQVDLRLAEAAAFGSALVHATGSKQHNVDLRTRAEKMGLSLSEYGITDNFTGNLEKYASEEAFYNRQGLDYIPPEIREGQHEIELAEKHSLPRLVDVSDIQGDLHVHSEWSDGHENLETLLLAAQSRGYKYLAITDHSVGLGIARGLNSEKVHRQIESIRELNRKYQGIRLLTGMEVDIKSDGSLGMPDEILADLDLVLASIHSGMNQEEDRMTERIVSALANPHVDILAHPSARLLGERPPISFNIEKVFGSALRYNKGLEINSMPTRLDLKDSYIYLARQMGIPLSIDSDAHRLEHLDFIRFGVGIARRGWCEAKDILNTRPLSEIIEFAKHIAPQ